jgi:nucleoside-diphosphate-sugar epimerase
MTETIAITGATGFIGLALVPLLAERHRLRLLVRDPARLALAPGLDRQVEVIRGDLADAVAVRKLVTDAPMTVHLAGAIAAPSREAFAAANVEGTRLLAEAVAGAPGARLVHVSSLAAREPALSDYGWSKRAGEDAARERLGGRVTVLRPPAVYGPGDRATLPLLEQLSRQVAVLPVNPSQRLSLVHVDDLAAAIALLAQAGTGGGHVWEVDDETPGGYGWPDLVAAASRALNRPVRAVFLPRPVAAGVARIAAAAARLTGGEPLLAPGKVAELYHSDWVCRGSSLATLTPWRARIRFAEGFASTMAWYWREGWLRPPRGLATPRRDTSGVSDAP